MNGYGAIIIIIKNTYLYLGYDKGPNLKNAHILGYVNCLWIWNHFIMCFVRNFSAMQTVTYCRV